MSQPIPKEQVEVPEEALKATEPVEAAWGIYLPEDMQRELLQAVAGSIRAQERERLKAALKECIEDAYAVEDFIGRVTAWKGSDEDEQAEAKEAAERLCGALDTEPTDV
ncbi:MAG TPA: hypothetical protein VFJ76_07870 [Solirubrobacterales bacterium]|nr:hypothetical protein [Solirubrobacterales bacterium]